MLLLLFNQFDHSWSVPVASVNVVSVAPTVAGLLTLSVPVASVLVTATAPTAVGLLSLVVPAASVGVVVSSAGVIFTHVVPVPAAVVSVAVVGPDLAIYEPAVFKARLRGTRRGVALLHGRVVQ